MGIFVNNNLGFCCAINARFARGPHYPLPGNLHIGWFNLVSYRISARHDSSLRGRAGACEGIQDRVTRKGKHPNQPFG